jgi:hypothetical protein
MILVGAALTLATVVPVTAQQVPVTAQQSPGTVFMSNFNGVNPRAINNVPFDASKAMKNLNIPSTFRTPAQSKPFNLSHIFPKVQLGSWPPIVPNTPVLSQKNNPFQPNPLVGKNPFGQTPAK